MGQYRGDMQQKRCVSLTNQLVWDEGGQGDCYFHKARDLHLLGLVLYLRRMLCRFVGL